MDNRLYLMNGDEAVEMKVQKKGFEKEADLQKIIKDNPHLLARSMESGTLNKLFFIRQEINVKESEESGVYYYLDHLLVDEDGIPVLVEVKRSTDTRIKREVVGQMLDYASRASKWDINLIRQSFEDNNKDADSEQFDDAFWNKVAANLSAEHFRLVFAADVIPDSLRVLIEFMDRSMKDIEVYGVELKPYVNGSSMLLASNIVGNSVLDSKKAASSGKRESYTRTVEEFKEDFRIRGFSNLIPVFEEIYDFILKLGLTWKSGTGASHPAYKAQIGDVTLFRIFIWHLYNSAYRVRAEFDLERICKLFPEEQNIETIRAKLIAFPELDSDISEMLIQTTDGTLKFELSLLKETENMLSFQNAITEIVNDIRKSS